MHRAAAKEMDDRYQLLCSLKALCRNFTMMHLVFIIEESMSIVLYKYPMIQLVFLSHCFGFGEKRDGLPRSRRYCSQTENGVPPPPAAYSSDLV